MQGYKILFSTKKGFWESIKKERHHDKETDGKAKYKQVGYVTVKLKMCCGCKDAGKSEEIYFLLTFLMRLR